MNGVTARLACVIVLVCTAGAVGADRDGRALVGDRITKLTRDSVWRRVAAVPLGFDAHHPQGLVKVGDEFFLSSVEIRVRTKPTKGEGRYDRDAGEGAAHLFRFDGKGKLLSDVPLGAGTLYHPGGIDYDGRFLWVPVAEYRPNSRAIVYRVDPVTMKAEEIHRLDDHLGAVAYDTDARELHAVSWGSRLFYRWTAAGTLLRSESPSHYIDYQDCKYAGRGRMWCTGVANINGPQEPFRLGGFDLIKLSDSRPLWQVPLLLWTAAGLDMVHNATCFEPTAKGVRGYFLPEDGRSTLYVYEVDTE